MSLVTCQNCGKEISDRAIKCVHCGFPIKNKCVNKKSILCLGGIITLILLIITFFVTNEVLKLEIELTIYALVGIVFLYLSILLFIIGKNNVSYTRKKINKFYVLAIASLFGFCFCAFVYIINAPYIFDNSYNSINDNITVHVFYYDDCSHCNNLFDYLDTISIPFHLKRHDISNDEERKLFNKVLKYFNIEDNSVPLMVVNDKFQIGFDMDNKENTKLIIEQEHDTYSSQFLTDDEIKIFDLVDKIKNDTIMSIIDNRTSKQKVIDYLKENEVATCTESKCTYTFEVYGLNDVDYYTVDFDNKKFILQSYLNGTSYTEYDYFNNKGYSKNVFTSAWTTTTTIDVTFNDDNTYNWICNSDLPGYCDSSGSDLSDIIVNLRNSFLIICNDLGVNPSDI